MDIFTHEISYPNPKFNFFFQSALMNEIDLDVREFFKTHVQLVILVHMRFSVIVQIHDQTPAFSFNVPLQPDSPPGHVVPPTKITQKMVKIDTTTTHTHLLPPPPTQTQPHKTHISSVMWNLVESATRVATWMAKHLDTSRESKLLPPFTEARSFITLTLRGPRRHHTVWCVMCV